MKISLALILTLSCTTFALAADPAPTCVEEKIAVEKMKQQNAQLMQQVMQSQFQQSTQTQAAAKAEEARLQGLLPKKPDEKKVDEKK